MNDEQLRQLYARATEARTDSRRAECPESEALEALARGDGPEETRLRTLDHVMACADCQQDFELFRAIEQARRVEAGAVVTHARWMRPRVLTIGAALAAGLVAVAVLQPWSTQPLGRQGSDVVRSAAPDVALAGPAADTVVSPGDRPFVWRSVAGARRYSLEVLTPAGVVRAIRETTDTTATVRGAELGEGDLRWDVRAQMDGGELRSVTRRLHVGGP